MSSVDTHPPLQGDRCILAAMARVQPSTLSLCARRRFIVAALTLICTFGCILVVIRRERPAFLPQDASFAFTDRHPHRWFLIGWQQSFRLVPTHGGFRVARPQVEDYYWSPRPRAQVSSECRILASNVADHVPAVDIFDWGLITGNDHIIEGVPVDAQTLLVVRREETIWESLLDRLGI